MKAIHLVKGGGILFFIGVIFIVYAWNASYPISIPSTLNENIFYSFNPLIWPGIIFSLIGLFFIAYYCQNLILKIFCSILAPLILYIYSFFFTYIPSSDSGNVRGMFYVFDMAGANSHIVPYFEFPNYFSLNEVIHQVVSLDVKGVALLSFIVYGALLGLFLYLFFYRLYDKNSNQILPFIFIFVYFIGLFALLNYQWVPQTLALVYFALLLYISTFMLSRPLRIEWSVLFILLFLPLLFTHAFFPLIFIFFFGFLTIRKSHLLPLFLVILLCYVLWTIFHTVYHFELYLTTLEQSVNGFGHEYTKSVGNSLGKPGDLLDQIISFSNRITVPLVWGLASLGTVMLFIKRKLDFTLVALVVIGFFYLGVGLFYSILGLRAAQVLFIPLTVGFMFFFFKWKTVTIVVIVVMLVLSVFGPMRTAYNFTQFQTDEEACGCNFLVKDLSKAARPEVAVSQVNWGYFTNRYYLMNNINVNDFAIRPGTPEFLEMFRSSLNQSNYSMHRNDYVFYNTNMGKEMLQFVLTKNELNSLIDVFRTNNRVFDSGTTSIINGAKRYGVIQNNEIT